ncbi:hypothetical protein HNY73_021533 [Argiope bruennichi]|uniref:Uncharacterized protein n=1 Tax=Argiope bruennichi TaxID=94029 RepID=A0A8T0DXT9_ARGBR|nr:hypothetical protein HNY73_021533 [Argiope bruennichi]
MNYRESLLSNEPNGCTAAIIPNDTMSCGAIIASFSRAFLPPVVSPSRPEAGLLAQGLLFLVNKKTGLRFLSSLEAFAVKAMGKYKVKATAFDKSDLVANEVEYSKIKAYDYHENQVCCDTFFLVLFRLQLSGRLEVDHKCGTEGNG